MDTKTKKLMENIFEISAIAENLQIVGNIHVEDSRELFHCALAWAEEFEAAFDEDGGKDYLMEIEEFAKTKLLKAFPAKVGDEREKRQLSFSLPNGAKIIAVTCGDADTAIGKTCGWSSIDIVLVLPNGERAVLCAVDFELAGGSRTHDVLRVLAYENDDEEPDYDAEFPWQHYSYWLQHEEADDTYDICFWDEFGNERGEQMEESRFPSEEAAMKRLSEIQRDKGHIWWIRRDDTIGKG